MRAKPQMPQGKPSEPTEMDNDLEESLLSTRNMLDLTLLALHENRHELIPTGIEETFYKIQTIMDKYCVVKEPCK